VKHLIEPYGGKPVDLLVPEGRAEALKKEALGLPSVDLDWRQIGRLIATVRPIMSSRRMSWKLSRWP